VGAGLLEGNFYYRSEGHHELSVFGQSRHTTFTVAGLVLRPTGLTKPGFRGDPNLAV
jgi:hypothetical protein